MSSEYILPRNRDAYSTIRGFVYQVDLTIRRWIDLSAGQHLELERGEDIDIVHRAITATSSEETRRLLEQVKHREQNITLRNPAALEALANTVEHLSANSNLDLRFCYTTNAGVGVERPCPFPNGIAGICLWEQVRLGKLSNQASDHATTLLAEFLSKAACPDGLDANIWTQFRQVVSMTDLTAFTNLMARFEWSTSTTGAVAITTEIVRLLVHRDLATDEAKAQQLYQRLFLFVFKRLCQSGVKRLTQVELRQQLSMETLSGTDRQTLSRLELCFSIVRLKVDEIEASLALVSENVRQLALTQDVHATLLRGTLTIDFTPPPVLARGSQRDEAVGRLVENLRQAVWTAVSGSSDTGKSQLAVLLIKRVGNLGGWVRFGHDLEPAVASAILDNAVGMLCGKSYPESASGSYDAACRKLGCGKIIVLDDLPRMNGTDPLCQRLLLLVNACKASGLRIVSTSHHELPAKLTSILIQTEFVFVPVPMLTETEVKETLMAYEAPDHILIGGAPRLIYASSGGHPLLVSLAANYLSEHEWHFTNDEVKGLLAGKHVESITDEVLTRIMDSLAEQQRELLYRLTLPVGGFVLDLVTALAKVDPGIDRPREQINKLLGQWVQRDAERRFIVSPLVKSVGSESLNEDTRKGCHLALAEFIIGETMSIYQAQHAISHFCAAEEFNRAGSLFLCLLDEARMLESGADLGLVDTMWANSPFPDRMDLNIKLLARGLQLAVLPKCDRDITYVLSDLDRLLAVATHAHRYAITSVAVMASVYLLSNDPDRTLQYIERALQVSNAEQNDVAATFLVKGRRLEDMLWFVVPHLVTASRLSRWLTVLEMLSPERRQRLLTEEDALLGCIVVTDQLRMKEAEKPEALRQWGNVLAAVELVRQRARKMNSGVLEGAAIRTLLTIYGENLRQIDNGTATATEAIERLSTDPKSIFLIAGMLGRQYAFAGRHAEARPMLEMAIEQPIGEVTHERMMTLLAASESFGVINTNRGIQYAEQAVQLARSEERIPTLEASRAGAELATALFLSVPTVEGAIAVFAAWSEAAERLIESRDESDEWKDLFVIFAHQTSYLTSLARMGQPPNAISTGEDFTAPVRGAFVRTHPGRIAYYRPSSVQAVMWMLSQYSTAASNEPAAATWLNRASTLTDSVRLRFVDALIGHDMIPSLITANKYADAIDAALRYCHAIHLFAQSRVQDQDVMERGVDLNVSWNNLSLADQETIERRAAILSVLPVTFLIFRQILENRTQGISQCRSLVSTCRQISSNSADSVLWSMIAEILDLVCQEQVSGHELVTLGNHDDANSRQTVKIVAYIGASLHGGTNDAFNAQLAVMQALFLAFPPDSEVHRQLLVPFIQVFWTDMFTHRRFSFNNPSFVQERLDQACLVPVEHRVKAILRAVRLGVNSRADLPTTAWLNNDN